MAVVVVGWQWQWVVVNVTVTVAVWQVTVCGRVAVWHSVSGSGGVYMTVAVANVRVSYGWQLYGCGSLSA
jgi:hypothetical protein